MTTKVWNSTMTVEQALELPTGRIAADFGFLVEQTVEPDWTLEAATYLIEKQIPGSFASQAKIIQVAQANECPAFDGYAPLETF